MRMLIGLALALCACAQPRFTTYVPCEIIHQSPGRIVVECDTKAAADEFRKQHPPDPSVVITVRP